MRPNSSNLALGVRHWAFAVFFLFISAFLLPPSAFTQITGPQAVTKRASTAGTLPNRVVNPPVDFGPGDLTINGVPVTTPTGGGSYWDTVITNNGITHSSAGSILTLGLGDITPGSVTASSFIDSQGALSGFLFRDRTDSSFTWTLYSGGGAGIMNFWNATNGNVFRLTYDGKISSATWQGVIVASAYGGTGNGFTKFSGPTTAERTKTLRDAADTILELGGSYTPTGTWTFTSAAVAVTTQAVDTNTTAPASTAFVLGQAGTGTPIMNGTATAGTSKRYSPQDHVHPTDTSRVPTLRTVTAGAGLTGGGDLSADRTFNIGAGLGITVNADDVALTTPGSLSISSTNSSSGSHTHAITSSSNPGAAASLLATDPSGFLTLKRLTLTDYLFVNNSNALIYLKDTVTGFQAVNSQVLLLQAGNFLRNSAFSSGTLGWNVADNGDAEFNNVTVRGELRSSVFKVSEIAATAGTFGVFYSAANLAASCTTAAAVFPGAGYQFVITAKNSDAGGRLFNTGDYIRVKAWNGTAIVDAWGSIDGFTNNGATTDYVVALRSGSTSATVPAGTAVVDYGPSGTGFITQSADGTIGSSPNLTMATHAGSPWSSQTTLFRAGNLNGSYGYASNIYGIGIGQYGVASEPWWTWDLTNGIRVGNNTTIYSQWFPNGDLQIGQTGSGQSNVFITSGAVKLRNNTTDYISLDSSGNALFGLTASSQGNVYISGGTVSIRRGTTDYITLNATDAQFTNLIKMSGPNAAISLGTTPPTSATAGTGIWLDRNSIVSLSSNTQNVVLDSAGITAGAGNVTLNSTGLMLVSDTSYFGSSTAAVSWKNGGTSIGFLTNLYSGSSSVTALTGRSKASETSAANLETQSSGGTRTALFTLKKATDNTSWGELRGDNSNTFYGLSIGGTALINAPTHLLEVNGTSWFQDNVTVGNGSTGTNQQHLIINGGSGTGGSAALWLQNNGTTASIFGTEMSILGSGSNTKTTIYSSNTTFRLYGMGAGTLSTDASGNITASSDESLKVIEGTFDRGMADLRGLKPKKGHWTAASGFDTTEQYVWLTAQDLLPHIPEAVFVGDNGKHTVDRGPVLDTVVNALNELDARLAKLEGPAAPKPDSSDRKKLSTDRIAQLQSRLQQRKIAEPKPLATPKPTTTPTATSKPTPKPPPK